MSSAFSSLIIFVDENLKVNRLATAQIETCCQTATAFNDDAQEHARQRHRGLRRRRHRGREQATLQATRRRSGLSPVAVAAQHGAARRWGRPTSQAGQRWKAAGGEVAPTSERGRIPPAPRAQRAVSERPAQRWVRTISTFLLSLSLMGGFSFSHTLFCPQSIFVFPSCHSGVWMMILVFCGHLLLWG